MRALAVVLLLSVPLVADDKSTLEKAVELFRSGDAGQRGAGSHLVERELRKLLAPLLQALKDKDPEVRRRARRSILSLVPGEVEKDEAKIKPTVVAVIGIGGGAGGAFRGRAGRRGFRRVRAVSEPLQPTQKQRAELSRKGGKLFAGLGLHWKTQWRPPRMPGFFVEKVNRGSPAARLGLRKGDLIVRIDGKDVARPREIPKKAPDWSRATLTVYRGGRYVRLPAK